MSFIRHAVLMVSACDDAVAALWREDALATFTMSDPEDLYWSAAVSDVAKGMKGYRGFSVAMPGRMPADLVHAYVRRLEAARLEDPTSLLEYVVVQYGGDSDDALVLYQSVDL